MLSLSRCPSGAARFRRLFDATVIRLSRSAHLFWALARQQPRRAWLDGARVSGYREALGSVALVSVVFGPVDRI
eukprot:7097794-Alexandrium_andersonii.AAC.1